MPGTAPTQDVAEGDLGGKVAPELHARLAEGGGPVTVIVTLDTQASEATARLAVGDLSPEESEPLAALRRADYRTMKSRALSSPAIRVVRELAELPSVVVEVDSPEGLAALEASADVLTAQPEGSYTPQMQDGLNMTNSLQAQSGWGYYGAGVTVAVVDTGVDYGLSNFGSCTDAANSCSHGACDTGGALVSGCNPCVTSICAANPACCSGAWDASCVAAVATTCGVTCGSANPGADTIVTGGTCGVAVARDFAPSDGHRDDTSTQFARHGTAVADIIHAMAPQAKIAALDVFREGTTSILESDVLTALDWVMTNRTTYNIKVVNLSFGTGAFTSPCPTHNLAASIDALKAVGVLTVAAAGNDGRTDALMGPACVPSVLSVGAIRDYGPQVQPTFYGCSDSYPYSGYVSCFSNVAPFLDLVAPGTQVLHSGFTVNDIVSSSTSMAAAFAAGAAAQTASAFPFEGALDWHKRLMYGGYSTSDPRDWKQYPQLDVMGAVYGCVLGLDKYAATFDFNGGAGAVAVDVVPASCQFRIDNYSPDWVHVNAAPPPPPPQAPPIGSCSHDLCLNTGGTGFLVNGCTPCTTSICAVDPWCCSQGWDSACVNEVAAYCSPFTCGGGGGGSPTTYTGPQTVPYTVDPGPFYRYATLYFAGFSAWNTDYYSVEQTFASGPPQVSSFTINGGATYATAPVATVSSVVSDGTAVAEMCISSTTNCTVWQPYSTSKSFGLASGDGVKTLYGKFRDDFGNVSTQVSDTIIMDVTPPVNGTLTATATSGAIALSWTGFSDATSGLASYKLVYSTSPSAPTSCATGTVLLAAAGPAVTSYSHAGVVNGTTYRYRLCATDNAGKTSSGSTASARPAPEYTPPTGTVAINAGASFATSGLAVLTFAASDASGLGSVCVNQTGATCTGWTSFPASNTMNYYLSTSPGTKTVYVWFRDIWNNETVVPTTDTIMMDVLQSSVTATGTDGRIQVSWASTPTVPLGADAWYVNRATTSMASCSVGTNVYQGANNSFIDVVANDGTLYYYRVCIRAFGELSPGREVSARAKPESDPPTGTLTISGTPAPGTTYVNSTAVTLTISASDASALLGPVEMCVTNSTVCSAWEAFAPVKAWTTTTGSGTKTVRVFLRDVFYNTTTTGQAATDTIILDVTAPSNGTLTATPVAGGRVDLSWSGQTDSLSGFAGVRIVTQLNTPPSNCTSGTVLVDYGTSGSTFAHGGLASGSRWGYRLCARDTLGNTSVGTTRTATLP